MEQTRVAVQATDPLSHAGLAALLQFRGDLTVLRNAQRAEADVLVVAAERLSTEVVATLRRSNAETTAPVVLVVSEIDEGDLLTAVECRVVAILPRGAVSADRLAHSVKAAACGGGVLPPNLVGELLKHVERMQRDVLTPNGLNASGLTPREIDVLRLMADGFDTNEIAGKLCYSERTVKNVIYGVTHRLKLRNRSHAVAYALRAGMI
ncbi:helix-turn-helix transcriptional regulator [Paractinoplanes brasiliensis]|uniref:DNA-binding NarL/FixJ family response regulator n=1 Tax=Paractinoplanes brasiliensis TaxID=52695 RepID=A0A4R6JTH3_9ACTN|nr:response regulator transcription factor [Actinoplanes brasiliensis]MDY7087460.1 response regulator transcription factor [Actinomycetota bacterium]TDO39082.1 DNA-binding NarL/FixJ family response regulator [Actinoplanes brasiliensis]GID30218.1 helix-turn-helix transcriptional regulator [Actinoplanes brasiliensis]